MSQPLSLTYENGSVIATQDSGTVTISIGTDVSSFSLTLQLVQTAGDGWTEFIPAYIVGNSITNSSGTRSWDVKLVSNDSPGSAGIVLKPGIVTSRAQAE